MLCALERHPVLRTLPNEISESVGLLHKKGSLYGILEQSGEEIAHHLSAFCTPISGVKSYAFREVLNSM